MKKTILAFSGGLDTTFCIPYLQEKGYEIITATINTGGFSQKELKDIAYKSKKYGAKKHYEIDAQESLFHTFGSYIIKANYLKGGVYPACVGPERIIIAMELAKIAQKEKTTVITHGSTGAGNDQVRFDVALKALIPKCEIITPIRTEGLSREAEVNYLKKHGIKIDQSTKDYSINVGLLGTTIGGKETKNTEAPLPDSIFPSVKSVDTSKKTTTKVKVHFEKGLPIKLNGKKMKSVPLIQKLNTIASQNGYGKDYHIGTTIIGLKGKIGFEAPALKALIKAHTELEKCVLTSKQIFWKNHMGTVYGDMVHEGLYFDPLIKDIESFLDSGNTFVTGEVVLSFYKGNLIIESVKSKYSLFSNKIGIYGEEHMAWDGKEAEGFCKLYGQEGVNAHLLQNI